MKSFILTYTQLDLPPLTAHGMIMFTVTHGHPAKAHHEPGKTQIFGNQSVGTEDFYTFIIQ